MRRIKNYLLVTLGFGLAGAIGAGFATGTAQAIVASLVQVVNPATAPVPTLSVTDPGRIAYQSTVDLADPTPMCPGNPTCFFTFPPVPSGHRVVVQHIAGYVGVGVGMTPSFTRISVRGGNPAFFTEFYTSGAPGIGAATSSQVFDQPVLFYLDGGSGVTVTAQSDGGVAEGIVTLTGYELDCTVASCQPIATQ